jgi:hypothetical protein
LIFLSFFSSAAGTKLIVFESNSSCRKNIGVKRIDNVIGVLLRDLRASPAGICKILNRKALFIYFLLLIFQCKLQ